MQENDVTGPAKTAEVEVEVEGHFVVPAPAENAEKPFVASRTDDSGDETPEVEGHLLAPAPPAPEGVGYLSWNRID